MAIKFEMKDLNPKGRFAERHIGPNSDERQQMLSELGFSSMDELVDKTVPRNIRTDFQMDLGEGLSEDELLTELKAILGKNEVFDSLIGLGFHDTITPTVIQRHLFENPAWYTAYTPYQPEISQGRLEALLNFQTMVSDLTGMELANASLLDEGTAAAEAMALSFSLRSNKKAMTCFVAEDCHPHVIEVLRTRTEPLGILLEVGSVDSFQASSETHFCAIVQYPSTEGVARNYGDFAEKAHAQAVNVVAVADLLSLTLLKAPGEWGADIVVGNSQRFGVPLGFGGPHAAFFATKDKYKRSMPGRIVGVSVDSKGQRALRLALQTREQHIRREKATSNICTAQVLLANMASMYAVYHGPKGLKEIALRIHHFASLAEAGLKKLGFTTSDNAYFDTIKVTLGSSEEQQQILAEAQKLRLNFRALGEKAISLSFNERTKIATLTKVYQAFAGKKDFGFSLESLAEGVTSSIPGSLERTSDYLTHPVFNTHHSETELMRYLQSLANKDLSLVHSMIPLGSCTMKLNSATELTAVSWPEANRIHPFAPKEQSLGYKELIADLERMLCEVTGFAAVSLQPNAGSQGEYAGLLAIRKYHESRGDQSRNICLIPSSAHGTNPASAVMAGMKVVVTNCDDQGNIDVNDLKKKCDEHRDDLAALMITYPSTHGVFEESVIEICKMVHDAGGMVYMDGANMNAMVGICRPTDIGADVCHLNLHKTFAIPHGGGGPGVGPIGVAKHLAPYLPRLEMVPESGPSTGTGSTTSAPWGSASILPISWSYIKLLGSEGLRQATQTAILNANYVAKKLSSHYPVLYKGKEGLVAHECILDTRPLKKETGVDVNDIAKRLMDFGFHAPTMSFPVAGTLMIEPTESESKHELDRFIEAMIQIKKEADKIGSGEWDSQNNPLMQAPHTASDLSSDSWERPYSRQEAGFALSWLATDKYWTPVGRVDNAYGDRNLVCQCPSIEEYK